jgi:hypothetical protein
MEIAKAPIPNTEVRYVFIEGPAEKYDFARGQIEEIVAEVKINIDFSNKN